MLLFFKSEPWYRICEKKHPAYVWNPLEIVKRTSFRAVRERLFCCCFTSATRKKTCHVNHVSMDRGSIFSLKMFGSISYPCGIFFGVHKFRSKSILSTTVKGSSSPFAWALLSPSSCCNAAKRARHQGGKATKTNLKRTRCRKKESQKCCDWLDLFS